MLKFNNFSIFSKLIIFIGLILSGYALTQSTFVYFQIHADFLAQKNNIINTKKAEITEKVDMVYELAKQVYQEETKIENIEKNYSNKLKGIIDSTFSMLDYLYNSLKQQGVSDEQIQAQLKDYLRHIRYDEGAGYIFTYNMQGNIISHADLSLENQYFLNKQDALGKYFVQEFMTIGKSSAGEGVSHYYWNKLGYEKPQLKVSYLKRFEPYQWVIGTGVYVEDVLPELQERIAQLITSYFYDIGKTQHNYFFILTEQGNTVSNGGFPALNGKSVWDFQDATGHAFVQTMIKTARDTKSHNGFVEYVWPHPTTGVEMPKLTRVQWFEPLKWTIATGIYLEDLGIEEIQNNLQQKIYLIIQRIILSGSLFLLLSIFMSIGLVRLLTNPLILARNAAIEISNGNFSQKIIYTANDEIGQLVDTLNSMAKHLQQSFDQLNQKNEKLIALNQDKNEFLGIAAHDLKNPLSGILGLSECILESNGEITTGELMEYTGLIKDSAERMFLIVTNLLDVNKLESGKIDANLKFTNILPIIQKSYQDYQDRAKSKQLTMHLTADESIYIAYVDHELVYQIMDNLISNAIKYSPINKNIYVRIFAQKTTIRCEIQDEGSGLTVIDQEKLFGKFQRLSTQPTGDEHSTGLGLFIVKKLVEIQRGRVWCESELGQGANFIVEFPNF